MTTGYDDHESYNNTDAAIRAGMALAEPKVVFAEQGWEPHLAAVLPAGAKLEIRDIEKYMLRPARKRGLYAFEDAKSFIEFVNREKTPETIILASRAHTAFTAVFNGNEAQSAIGSEGKPQPGWGDYRASYSCPFSPEWTEWVAANGKKMSQADFATFIEDNFTDIVQPAPTFDPLTPSWPSGDDMMRVSRGISAKQDVNFGSAIRLDNGQVRFRYEETISGSVQDGFLEVPQKFAVGIPVFAGTAPWQIIARLRWRIERGGLTMWFDFERLFKITERAFDEAREQIATGTGVPVYLGTAYTDGKS